MFILLITTFFFQLVDCMVQNWDLVRHAINLLDQGKTVAIIATQAGQYNVLKYLLGSTYEQHIIFDFLFNYWDKCYNIQPGTIVLYETRRYVCNGDYII